MDKESGWRKDRLLVYTFMVNSKEKWESIGKVGEVTKTVAQARLGERRSQVRLGQLDMIGVKIPTSADSQENI